MDFHWVWKAIIIVFVGIMILRLGGRKSISQLTVSQTVIMISIGNLMIQPVSERNIWITFLIALLLVLTLIFIEFLQVKSDKIESFFTGKSIVVIEDGVINTKNLKKLRLTIDQLEMRLRQSNVQHISQVKWATVEVSGQLGLILDEQSQVATKKDIQAVLDYIHAMHPAGQPPPNITQGNNYPTLFTESKLRKHPTGPPSRPLD
ncbi:DUF421 domain-containing protein [Alkalihalobacterium chitinilyticum]|uniref:DUF421 domain-containing protein n=1 Tax=Alkalihalobacterium chitinilyticum TaxID=2980103 RepID=A0ABT5VH07_9BACI|nr:YetF domain-containing protein [Alkalihalobacterium chitinilyticum]MDE5414738.1 DUF421 domain-containing protein [Alkalihalobacterium chitinilyticum]